MVAVSPAASDAGVSQGGTQTQDLREDVGGTVRRGLQWLICGLPLALGLLYLPSLYAPFSSPKNALLIASSVALFSCAAAGGLLRRPAETVRANAVVAVYAVVLVASWVASPRSDMGKYALLMSLAGPLLFVASRAVMRGAEGRVLLTIALAGATQAAVALAQWAFGFDVFRILGGSSARVVGRMQIYGTLGNPDFVAGFLTACMPATVTLACVGRRWMRWTWGAVVAAEFAAIAGSGCRTGLFAAAVGAAVTLVLRALPNRAEVMRRVALGAVVVMLMGAATAAVVWRNPRGVVDSARGRLFVWEVASAEGNWRTVLGSGPGTFAYGYPARIGVVLQRHGDRKLARYIGYERSAFNDFLQAVIETGWLGALALMAVFGWWLRSVWQSLMGLAKADAEVEQRGVIAASLGAVTALLVVSIVESPFQRAETWGLMWLWMALAMTVDGAQAEKRRGPATSAVRSLGWVVAVVVTAAVVWVVAQPVIASRWEGEGDRLETQHRYPEAAAAYGRALSHDPSLPNANYCLTRSLAVSGDIAGGLRASEVSLRWVDEPELRLMRAYMMEAQNDNPGAMRELLTSLRLFPFSWKLGAELAAVSARALHPMANPAAVE